MRPAVWSKKQKKKQHKKTTTHTYSCLGKSFIVGTNLLRSKIAISPVPFIEYSLGLSAGVKRWLPIVPLDPSKRSLDPRSSVLQQRSVVGRRRSKARWRRRWSTSNDVSGKGDRWHKLLPILKGTAVSIRPSAGLALFSYLFCNLL